MKRFPLSSRHFALGALGAALALGGCAAHAGEVYGNLGFPGVGLGYAHPLGSSFAVRGDFMTLGTRRETRNEEGIDYKGELKASRAALFADWFPFDGTFRLTAGVGAANYKLTLDASGAGKVIEVGDNSYVLGPNDGLNVQVKLPRTMPYLGIGWGHQEASGLRFSFDLGALIGKAKVTTTARGSLATTPGFQDDLDKETAELRDGAGKIKALPQITFSVGYSF